MADQDDIPEAGDGRPSKADAAGEDAAAAGADRDAPQSPFRRVLRIAVLTVAGLVGAVLVLLVLFVLALQTNAGGRQFGDLLLTIANPYSEAYTQFDRVAGNFVSRLELHDLRIYRIDTVYVDTMATTPPSIRYVRKDSLGPGEDPASFDGITLDTLQMASVDTFRMRYNLLGLLQKRVHFAEITLSTPVLRARQRPDSTWDLMAPFRGDTTRTTGPSFSFLIDRLSVTDGDLFAIYDPPNPDSVLRVERFNVEARDVRFGQDVRAVLDTLHAAYAPPGRESWAEVRAGGAIQDGDVSLAGFELSSPQSLVSASGSLRLPSETGGEVEAIDFALDADPIHFRDLHPFLPELNPQRFATLTARATGTSEKLRLDAAGTLSDGATFSFDGEVTPILEGPMTFAGQAAVSEFHPSFFTAMGDAESGPTRLNADVTFDLSGPRLQALQGTADARVSRSALGGIPIPSARLLTTLEDGEARVDLTSNWNDSRLRAEGFIRPFDDTPAYRFDGTLQRVNLAELGLEDRVTDVNGTFTVEGYGFNPKTAEISGSADVASSTVNAMRIDDGRVEFEIAGGELTYGLRFLFPNGLLVANGDAALDTPLTFNVQRGRMENVDLAALLGANVESALTGRFTAQGTGSDPQTMSLQAALDMEPSTYGAYQLLEGSLQMQLNDGRLELTSNADLADAGRYTVRATTRPFDDVPVVNITQADFVDVDLTTLLQNPEMSGELNGSAALTVRGFDPATMSLDGTVRLSNSRINEQVVTAATVQMAFAAGAVSFDAGVTMPESNILLTGTARPFLDEPTYDITDGSFENVDLAAWTGNPSLRSNLNGTMVIDGTGLDPQSLQAEGSIDLDASQFNEQPIRSATFRGTVAAGVFDVDLTLDVPEGRTQLAGTVQPFLSTPTYTISTGTFDGIDIGALTGNPDVQTDLAGTISLSGRGFHPDSMSADGSVLFDASSVNGVPLRQGRLEASIADGEATFDADLAFVDGSASLRGVGRFFDAEPTYDLSGTLANVRLGQLAGSDTLAARASAQFDMQGTGTNPRTMRLEGRLTSGGAEIEGSTVDTLYAQFLLDNGLLRVDSLFLRSSAVDASGSGLIAAFDRSATSNFTFTADLKDLRPLRPFLAAQQLQLEEGRIDGRIYGNPGSVRFDVTGRVNSFIYNTVRLSEFEGTLTGEIDPDLGLTIAEIDGRFETISLPQLLVDAADLSVTYERGAIQFSGDVRIDEGRTATIGGRVETEAEAQRIVIETLDLELDGDRWELLQTATISYGDVYRVSNLLLHSGDQQLAVDGIIDPNGTQNLVLTVENVQMASVADMLGYEGLAGSVTGSLMMTGAAEAPEMSGTLYTQIASYGSDVGRLRLSLDYEELRLHVDALLTHEDGSTLEATGYLPLDLRVARLDDGSRPEDLAQGGVDLTITADSFNVGWIEPFLDPESVDEFEGRFVADVRVGGTMSSPVVDGSARFLEGSIGLPELGLTYRGIQSDFTLQQNVVQVQNLLIQSGDGRVRGNGTINLAELTLGEFNVALDAQDFLAIDSREYRFVVDGDMQLSGTTQRPNLEGDVEVVSGEIVLTDESPSAELEQVSLSVEQLQTVERRFGIHITAQDTTTFSLYNALAMDLDVNIERDTWIRSRVNPIMDIQFSGDLELAKNHYQDVNMFGTIEVVPQRSRIIQFGKRFDITSGTLTFNGPAVDPFINVEAAYNARPFRGTDPGVMITLGIEGRMSEQLNLTLGSDEPMEYTDIVSYIATGRPASPDLYLGGAGSTLLGTGTGLALGQLTAIMEGVAESGLGLDVVTLEQRPAGEFLTAGSYVTPKLFVSISQPVNIIGGQTSGQDAANRPVFTLEYEIQNWLLAQLTQQNQALRLNLQFEYAY